MTTIDTSYPLHWPEGWPRCKVSWERRRAPFGAGRTLAQARDELFRQLRLLGVDQRTVIISTNVQLRRDGLPYSGQAQPQDRGVAVYFKLLGADRVLASDRWDKVETNLIAIARHIDAIRAQERLGVGTVEQAFRGYTALPEGNPWWKVLGLSSQSASIADIEDAYIRGAQVCHPDKGGTGDAMAALNAARAEGRRARGAA